MKLRKAISQKSVFYSLIAISTFSFSHSAWSTGFQLPVQNVTNLGTAYAGTASLAEDASTGFYNAAGLTRLCGQQLVLGGTYIQSHTSLDVSSYRSTFGTSPFPNTGSTRPKDSAFVPSFHYSQRLDECWVYSVSAVTTFGSVRNYKDDSIARYTATRSELVTMDLAPSIAYRFNEHFSLGGGPDILYAKAKLDSQVGLGNIGTDGFSKTRGDNVAPGFHIGALYEFNDCTRFGVNYRSRMTAKLKGYNITQLAAGASVTRLGARANLELPDFAVASLYHAFNEQWAAMADYQWTHWKRFNQIVLNFSNGTQAITTANYRNSYLIALGGIYQYDSCWQIKAGVSYDKSPVRNEYRTIYTPDQDQTTLAVGTQYRINQCMAVDLAYARVIYKRASINQQAPTSIGFPQGLQSIQGSTKTQLNVFGVQLTWDIG